jgi:hypothetical protein
MIGCDCNAGLSNTGRPACVPIQSVTSSLIVVPLTANDGTKNGIDLNSPLPTWSDLINEADASKRWFPLPAFENVELPKADSQFEEANSGRMAFLRQGKRSFSGELWAEDSTPTFLGKLTKSRCVDFGIYIVDVNGNLIGSEVDGYLYPIPVDNPSWDPRFMFATDSTVQKIMLGFDFDRLFDEATMYMITPEEASQNFNDLDGLIDVVFSNIVPAGTFDEITFDAKFEYGTALNKLLYTGATNIADWELYINGVLTPLSGAPTENPDGTYSITFAAQLSGDVAKVVVAKTGFDGEFTVTL